MQVFLKILYCNGPLNLTLTVTAKKQRIFVWPRNSYSDITNQDHQIYKERVDLSSSHNIVEEWHRLIKNDDLKFLSGSEEMIIFSSLCLRLQQTSEILRFWFQTLR